MRLASVLVALAIGGMIAARPAIADPHAGLPSPAYDVYHAMLEYTRDGNFDRLAKSMKYAAGLMHELGRECGADFEQELRDAIAKRDAALARATLHKLIATDIRRLVARAGAASGWSKRETVQVAYAVFGLVDGAVANVGEVRAAFKELYKATDPDATRARARYIIERVTAAFPHCPHP